MTLSREEGGVGGGGGGLEGKSFPRLPLKIIFLCTICDAIFHAITLQNKLPETFHLNAPCGGQKKQVHENRCRK